MTTVQESQHHAKWRELTADEQAAAVAALRELAGGRADLRAEVCGVTEGASEGEPHEPLARQAAELCRKPGAGPEATPRWIAEGHKRSDAARIPPFSGGLHGGGAPRRAGPEQRYTVSGGCASVSSWKSPQDEIYPVPGT